jgi:predicted permease
MPCVYCALLSNANMDVILKALIIAVVAILAIIIIVMIVFQFEERQKGKNGMTSVYGGSFMNLPHGPMKVAHLRQFERTMVSDAPSMAPTQVAGASFSRLL